MIKILESDFESYPMCVIMIDNEHNIVAMNNKFIKMFNFTSKEEV